MTSSLFIDGPAQRVVNRKQDTRATLEMIHVTYLPSARAAVYAQLAFLQNSRNGVYTISAAGASTPAKGKNQTAAMFGKRQSS